MPIRQSYISRFTHEPIHTVPILPCYTENTLYTAVHSDVHVSNKQQQQQVLKGFGDQVVDIKAKENGHVIVAYKEKGVCIWNVPQQQQQQQQQQEEGLETNKEASEKPKIIKSLKTQNSPPCQLCLHPILRTLAVAHADGTIRIYDKAYNQTHTLVNTHAPISALVFHPQHNDILFSATSTTVANITKWNLSTKQHINYTSHTATITALDISPDGKTMLSASRDTTCNLWDLQKDVLQYTFIGQGEPVEAAGFITPKDTCTILGEELGRKSILYWTIEKQHVRIWNGRTGEFIWELPDAEFLRAISASYDKENGTLMVLTRDQNLLIYKFAPRPHWLELQRTLVGYNQEILSMAQLNVQQIAVATNTDHIRLFDMNDWTCKLLDGHKGLVTCVDAYADRLISGSADMNAKLWENGICVATCTGHAEPITAVALRSTFAITASADRTIKCWDLQTLSQPSTYYTFQAHEKTINALDISPCGKFFASSGQDGLAKVWAVEDGTGVSIMKGHKRGVWCVKYSSGGKLLATGGADKTVRIWNPMSGECLKTLEGHTNSVLSVSFMSGDLQCISTSSDSMVKIWSLQAQECIKNLEAHDDKVWCHCVIDDGAKIITGGVDSKIICWDDNTIEEEGRKAAFEEARLVQAQDMDNYTRAGEWKAAVSLGLRMKVPGKLQTIFRSMLHTKAGIKGEVENTAESISGSPALDKLIPELPKEELDTLLEFITQWNTSMRTSQTAQMILHLILRSFSIESLSRLPQAQSRFEALFAYSKKHRGRWSQHLGTGYLINFMASEFDDLSLEVSSQDLNKIAGNRHGLVGR